MNDRACPVCDRICLDPAAVKCESCKWPLPGRRDPVFEVEKPYGHDLVIELVGPRRRVEKHFKGCECTCRRRAAMVRSFLRVIAVRPLTGKQYLAAYGEGRM